MIRVLFICEGNVGRSPMAEKLFAREAGDRHEARSAGTKPASGPSPPVGAVMLEVGIDITERMPRALTEADVEWADVVVITGHMQETPGFPGKRVITWDLPRIKGKPIEDVRRARDEIHRRVRNAVAELSQN